jgi:hypothetical protein
MTPVEEQAVAIVGRDLETDEGRVPYVYQDSLGYWTLGVGFLSTSGRAASCCPKRSTSSCSNRIRKVLAGCQGEAWYPAVANDPVRLAGVLNMQFQLGSESDEKFVNSFRFIAAKDWKRRGREPAAVALGQADAGPRWPRHSI